MKHCYIASPYSGDVEENIEFACTACRMAIAAGYTPIAPHLIYPQILDDSDPTQRETGIQLGLSLLSRCSELWVCGDIISAGMAREIETAERLGIPARRFSFVDIIDGVMPREAEEVNLPEDALTEYEQSGELNADICAYRNEYSARGWEPPSDMELRWRALHRHAEMQKLIAQCAAEGHRFVEYADGENGHSELSCERCGETHSLFW